VLVAGEGGRRGPAEGSGGGRGRPVGGGTEREGRREGGRAHAGGEVGGGDGRKGSRAAAQTQGSVVRFDYNPPSEIYRCAGSLFRAKRTQEREEKKQLSESLIILF